MAGCSEKSNSLTFARLDVFGPLWFRVTRLLHHWKSRYSKIMCTRDENCENDDITHPDESLLIEGHPVLDFERGPIVRFTFNGRPIEGFEGQPVLVSLRAAGVLKVRESPKKHLPSGPFCMQGRCCSCMMTVDGSPNVMTCVTPLKAGMVVESPDRERDAGYFKRMPGRKPDSTVAPEGDNRPGLKLDLAVIGAGPAGLEAALMAHEAGVERIALFDDKEYAGGQLKLQTHDFFGTQALGASVRGFEIGNQLEKRVRESCIDLRLNSTVVGMFPENWLIFRDGDRINHAHAKKIVVATGASEKMIPFPGNYLPGVIGAGGAQTFMNIHGVRPGRRVLIIGAGNIGVILAYQLLQAGIEVVEVVEAAGHIGAYGVHASKLRALGVAINTRHTIKAAYGTDHVEAADIVRLDENWREIPDSVRRVECDTICLAVGLSPLNELLWQAGCEFQWVPELGEIPKMDRYRRTSHRDIFCAGDCAAIGEASIARLEGRIAGLVAARDLGHEHPRFVAALEEAFRLLGSIQSGKFGEKLGVGKAKACGEPIPEPLKIRPFRQAADLSGVTETTRFKVILDCPQDIPCNPCEVSCGFGAIIVGPEINQPPDVDLEKCTGCGACVGKCPGRAIRLVKLDAGEGPEGPVSEVRVPWEFQPTPDIGSTVTVLDADGTPIGTGVVTRILGTRSKQDCTILGLKVAREIAMKVRTVPPPVQALPESDVTDAAQPVDELICRCEEVSRRSLENCIAAGYTSINDLKRLLRTGMGPCRGSGCRSVLEGRLAQVENVDKAALVAAKSARKTVSRPPVKRVTIGEAARMSFSQADLQELDELNRRNTVLLPELDKLAWTDIGISRRMKKKAVIIGGGISGVLTAWHLARMGWTDIAVVEKEFLAAGKTGACLGGLRTGFASANKVARARMGLEIMRDAEKLLGDSIGWFQGGYVYLAYDDGQADSFRKAAAVWDEGRVPYRYLTTESDLAHYVPGIDASKVKLGVFFEEAGGANPFLATYRFADDARKMGAEFIVGREVADIRVQDNRVRGVVLNDGTLIECEHVVNCAGAFAFRVSGMIGLDLTDRFWIERHGSMITEKLPFWMDALVVSYHPTLSGYWQQKRMEKDAIEGEIVACYSPDRPWHGYNTKSHVEFMSRMARSMLEVQPGLAEVGLVRHAAHHYVGRVSGIPLIGPCGEFDGRRLPGPTGFWHNIAKKGHGFMCAPGDGYALAWSMVNGELHPWISECTLEEDPSTIETMK